eukprot:tig00000056_g24054.t2
MRSKVREHARPSPASTAKWRPRLARWRSWRPGGKRPPGSFSRRPAQRVPFTRGWHLALLAAGARTASASSSPSATGGDGAAVTVTPPFSRFSLPR